jgi:hypothetical protein
MKLMTEEQRQLMLANGRANAACIEKDGNPIDNKPAVKLFCPWGGATWFLTELDPEDPDIAFGLCDLGMGFPEIGSVRLSEIAALLRPGDLRIERDMHFEADKTLTAYADEATRQGRIVV